MPLLCPCCSEKTHARCCKPFIDGQLVPQTPEQLMRSRYTAYSQAKTDYIKKTMRAKPLLQFNEEEAKKWAESIIWLGLKVIDTTMEEQNKGFVEFRASFLEKNQLKTIHERSEFYKHDEHWYYVDGINKETSKKNHSKIARNSACPCGSGKKFKNCHEQ